MSESFHEAVKSKTVELLRSQGLRITIPEENKAPIRNLIGAILGKDESRVPLDEAPHSTWKIAELQAVALVEEGETLADHPDMDPEIKGEVILALRGALRMLDAPFISMAD